MSDRFYHHGCPKTTWEAGIEFLPPDLKAFALDCIGEPDLRLMKNHAVQKDWIYFTTWNHSEKMERVIHKYLEGLAWESYGSW